jgi:hypothetical protein
LKPSLQSLLDDNDDHFANPSQTDMLLNNPALSFSANLSSASSPPVNGNGAVQDSLLLQDDSASPTGSSDRPVVELNIETQLFGHKLLQIMEGDDIEAKATEFCNEWHMQSYKASMVGVIEGRYNKKIAKRAGRLRGENMSGSESSPANVTYLV